MDGSLPQGLDRASAVAFADAAEKQGLAALLDDALGRMGSPWGGDVLQQLRQSHRANLAASLRRLDLAGRVLHLLQAAGLRALPLKGAAVAETLYESPAHRPMADVDVLVLDDWPEALTTLVAGGYTVSQHADHAVCLVDPASGDPVELHHSVTSCPGLFPMDARGLWDRRRSATGQVPWLPDPTDTLIMLAQHAVFQHGFALRLGQYLDIRRLLEQGAWEADALLDRADRARASGCLGLALTAAEALVGGCVPEQLRDALLARTTRGQRQLISRLTDWPDRYLEQALPSLARVRWEVSAGQRARLLYLTLAPRRGPGPDSASTRLRRWLQALPRAVSLALRTLGRGDHT